MGRHERRQLVNTAIAMGKWRALRQADSSASPDGEVKDCGLAHGRSASCTGDHGAGTESLCAAAGGRRRHQAAHNALPLLHCSTLSRDHYSQSLSRSMEASWPEERPSLEAPACGDGLQPLPRDRSRADEISSACDRGNGPSRRSCRRALLSMSPARALPALQPLQAHHSADRRSWRAQPCPQPCPATPLALSHRRHQPCCPRHAGM